MENCESKADILKLPLETRAEMALKAAVQKVIEEHARLRLPLHLWRNGKLVEMPAEELEKESAAKQ